MEPFPILATLPKDWCLPFCVPLGEKCRRIVQKHEMTDQGQVLRKAKWGNGIILKIHSRMQLVDILGVTSTDKIIICPGEQQPGKGLSKKYIYELHKHISLPWDLGFQFTCSQGLFILFKRIVRQNWEPAEEEKKLQIQSGLSPAAVCIEGINSPEC